MKKEFPGTERPGPQLFSFKGDNLLDRAWKHKSFEHLKTKWMYISFGDANSVGGAAQGIIPVQDAQGNLMGGSSPAAAEEKIAKAARHELSELETHIERIMEAVERNAEQIAALTDKQRTIDEEPAKSTNDSGYFDMSELSSHLGRINDSIEQNFTHIKGLAEKQFENEERLIGTIKESAPDRRADYLDMQQLSAHLDRIQSLMEQNTKERVDSAMAGEETEHSRGPEVDLSPLTELLEKIQSTIQQQSSHMEALVGFATGGGDGDRSSTPEPQADLSPVTGHLESIKSAIEANTSQVKAFTWAQSEDKDRNANDLSSLNSQLEGVRTAMEENTSHVKTLLDALSADEDGVADLGKGQDLSTLTEHLDKIHSAIEQNSSHVKSLIELQSERQETAETNDSTPAEQFDFTPFTDHLDRIHAAMEENSSQVHALVEAQSAQRKTASERRSLDMTPLTDHLNRIQSVMEKHVLQRRSSSPGTGDPKFIMSALTSHLSRIQTVTEQNATQIKTLREKQSASADKMHITIAQTAEQMQMLTQRTMRNEEAYQESMRQNAAQMRDLMNGQEQMVSVMREMTKSIAAQNPASCGHVVIPPPRKVGRRVVGFVYDAADGK